MLYLQFARSNGASAFDGVTLERCSPGALESLQAMDPGTDRIAVSEHATLQLLLAFPARAGEGDASQEQRICAALTPACRQIAGLGMVYAMSDDRTTRERTLDQHDEIYRAGVVLLHHDHLPREATGPLLKQAYLAGKQFGWNLLDAPRGEADRIAA